MLPAAADLPDPLEPYRQKRDFSATPEPAGEVASSSRSPRFVIQKHAARRLHYDFRLEMDGRLKSWAVPKGPSLDPHDKRMAVQVEDHPLSYADFEGTIPAGHYGAGTVIVWDHGTWQPQGDPQAGWLAGKLKFTLQGDKLSGAWMLVRMHGHRNERQEPWLLIKEADAAARPAAAFSVVEAQPDSVLAARPKPARRASTTAAKPPRKAAIQPADNSAPPAPPAPSALPAGARAAALPLALAPQLAVLAEQAPPGDDWTYEIKFDGYRLLARIDGTEVQLFTRQGHDWTHRLQPLAKAVKALQLPSGWLDGEIVAQGPSGVADFNALQNAFDAADTATICYYLFDIPYFDGHDLRQLPLHERRAFLARLLEGKTSPHIRFSEDFNAAPEDLLHNACQLRLEGLIAKRRDSPYVSRRSPAWVKLKCTHRQEFVIVGYTPPRGTRSGLGALLLAFHDGQQCLHYAGKVGTGFDAATLKALEKRLKPLAVADTPLDDKPADARGQWVQAQLVAEVSFAQWTPEGRIRHAVFHGLRSDKPPATVTQEKPVAASTLEAPAETSAALGKRKSHAADSVRITHPDRVIDATSGLTKRDLVDYYLLASRHLLVQLKDRPVAVVRAPSGVGGQQFFQKHAGKLELPGVKLLDPKLDPGHPPMMEIDSFTALSAAAQMNVIEFHTWNAKTRHIDKPDRMTFDLDPGEGVAWPAIQEAAQLTHALLDELHLKSFLKTSGGKGLHVVVPLAPRDDWDTVKGFSQAVVQHLAQVIPQRFVAKSGPKNRVGKIFVDYLRNGRGATTVSAFSVRARPGLGVSMPLAWDELPSLTSSAQWTLANAHECLEADDDPWADYANTRQTLTRAMKALGFKKQSSY